MTPAPWIRPGHRAEVAADLGDRGIDAGRIVDVAADVARLAARGADGGEGRDDLARGKHLGRFAADGEKIGILALGGGAGHEPLAERDLVVGAGEIGGLVKHRAPTEEAKAEPLLPGRRRRPPRR